MVCVGFEERSFLKKKNCYGTKSISGDSFARNEEKFQNVEDAAIYRGEMRRKFEFNQSRTRGSDLF